MRTHRKVNALEWLKSNQPYSFANGPENDQIIEFLEFLHEYGVTDSIVGVDEYEIYNSDEIEIRPTAELFITFPKNMSTENMISIMIEIGRLHPDEIDPERQDDLSIRLWWD